MTLSPNNELWLEEPEFKLANDAIKQQYGLGLASITLYDGNELTFKALRTGLEALPFDGSSILGQRARAIPATEAEPTAADDANRLIDQLIADGRDIDIKVLAHRSLADIILGRTPHRKIVTIETEDSATA